jgi:integrase
MAKMKITKRAVDKLPPCPPDKVCTLFFDRDLPGFGIKVFPSGRKVFFAEYGPRGRRRRMTIGTYAVLAPDDARELATDALASVVKGTDPLTDREERKAMPTFAGWVEEYLAGVRQRKKRPDVDVYHLQGTKPARKRVAKRIKGEVEDKRRKPRLALPMDRWGNRPLDSITRREVEAVVTTLAETGGRTNANRALASMRACFEAAVRAGVLKTNPAAYVKKNREGVPRSRVLTADELAAVVVVVNAIEDPYVRTAFHVLIETGARKSEVLRARWEDLDLEAATWRIPSPKAGHPQVIPLAAPTVARLRNLPPAGHWLVPGRADAAHRADLRKEWEAIKAAAGLHDVTIHDIRRTFGLAVAKAAGLYVASKLLRHGDVRITQRVYAPLGVEDLRKATDNLATERGKVLPMRPGRGK